MVGASFIILAAAQACVLLPEAKLSPSIPGSNARFGWSVDVGQDRIVVGAPESPAYGGGQRGVAYVFDRIGGTWLETAILADTKGPPNSPGMFGGSVSLDGDRIAVGAPESGDPSLKVFVYKMGGGIWFEEATLQPPPNYYLFGYALDLAGDTLIVGAPHSVLTGLGPPPPPPPPAGSVVVYAREPSGWKIQAHLQLGDAVSEQAFGMSVVLSGSTLFIGSPEAHGAAQNSGAVYVYQLNGTQWLFRQKLSASDAGPGHDFGYSLAANTDTLVVGARLATASTSVFSGAVYVFSKVGNTWVEKQKLISPSHVPGGCLPFTCFSHYTGNSVAILGDSLAFGAHGASYGHLFRRISGTWVDELQFREGGIQFPTNYGLSLAMYGTSLVVGAPTNPGAAYVSRIQSQNVQPRFYCTPKPVGHCTPRIFDVGQPSVIGATLGQEYLVWALELRDNVKAMLFYSLTGTANTPFFGGTLCVNPPLSRSMLVDTSGHWSVPCSGHPVFDFNAFIKSGIDPALVPGQQVWFQWWYREHWFPPPNNVGLTAGLTAIICQ
jgi:hypothetical protein